MSLIIEDPHCMGGDCGLEDACALGMIFDPTNNPRYYDMSVFELMQMFQDHRLRRVTKVQLMSKMVNRSQEELEERVRVYLGAKGVDNLPQNGRGYTPELIDFLYMYDVVEDTQEMMLPQ